ncbi:MAG: hypothetical protein AB1333_01055 [Patescibacteria group bacterium]
MILLIFIWFLLGCILALPYTYLAGGGVDGIMNFLSVAWISPVGAIVVSLVFMFSNKKEILKASTVGVYFCLPIIFNWLSKLAGILGYNELKLFLFDIRYPSLAYALVLVVIVTIIIFRIRKYKKRKRLRKRVPGN